MNHPLDAIAVRAFTEAMREERAGELLQHLFDGGGVTWHPDTGIVWIPTDVITELATGAVSDRDREVVDLTLGYLEANRLDDWLMRPTAEEILGGPSD